jgi:hypothetical protein
VHPHPAEDGSAFKPVREFERSEPLYHNKHRIAGKSVVKVPHVDVDLLILEAYKGES